MNRLVYNNKVKHKLLSLLLAITIFLEIISLSDKAYAKETNGITINHKLMIMIEGDKYELSASKWYLASSGGREFKMHEDVQGVKWKSSNDKVASVNSKGVITAKKPGRCIIKASYGNKTAECRVRVYTEAELARYAIDAEIACSPIYVALTTNYYKDYDLIRDTTYSHATHAVEIKAAKKAEQIIASVVTEGMSEFEKMMAIAKWMVENITYVSPYHISRAFSWVYNTGNREYYMLGPLLDGKADSRGLAYTFALLMNLSGVRSAYVNGDIFITDSGEERIVDGNVVELEGDFYYFNISKLAASYASYNDGETNHYKFYDLITPSGISDFIEFTNTVNRDGSYPRGFSYFKDSRFYIGLGGSFDFISEYVAYYYDFYDNKIKFVTKEDIKKNNDLYLDIKPTFSTFPPNPDSSSSKYKNIMKTQAELTYKMDLIYLNLLHYKKYGVYDIRIFDELNEEINSVIKEYEATKEKLVDRNVIPYMENKIGDIKKEYAELRQGS